MLITCSKSVTVDALVFGILLLSEDSRRSKIDCGDAQFIKAIRRSREAVRTCQQNRSTSSMIGGKGTNSFFAITKVVFDTECDINRMTELVLKHLGDLLNSLHPHQRHLRQDRSGQRCGSKDSVGYLVVAVAAPFQQLVYKVIAGWCQQLGRGNLLQDLLKLFGYGRPVSSTTVARRHISKNLFHAYFGRRRFLCALRFSLFSPNYRIPRHQINNARNVHEYDNCWT